MLGAGDGAWGVVWFTGEVKLEIDDNDVGYIEGKNMCDDYENQDENRIKANDAFNEFMDCFIKADVDYKNAIGNDILKLLLVKSDTDEQFNHALRCALDMMKMIEMLKGKPLNQI